MTTYNGEYGQREGTTGSTGRPGPASHRRPTLAWARRRQQRTDCEQAVARPRMRAAGWGAQSAPDMLSLYSFGGVAYAGSCPWLWRRQRQPI